jgi:hypothetical protein
MECVLSLVFLAFLAGSVVATPHEARLAGTLHPRWSKFSRSEAVSDAVLLMEIALTQQNLH